MKLLFFQRRLCFLVVMYLKMGDFTHAGQMNFYLSYAKEHRVLEGENPPVGLILCSDRQTSRILYRLHGQSLSVQSRLASSTAIPQKHRSRRGSCRRSGASVSSALPSGLVSLLISVRPLSATTCSGPTTPQR